MRKVFETEKGKGKNGKFEGEGGGEVDTDTKKKIQKFRSYVNVINLCNNKEKRKWKRDAIYTKSTKYFAM